jgi:serine/threonine protein kinase
MIGEVINERYKIEELLKEESQKTLYLALDLSQGKSCLVEMLFFNPNDAENIPAYLQQLQELKQQYHPQIPRIQDVFILEDELFPKICLITQQIEGTPLYQMLETKGRYSELETVNLMLQLARIAEYLHGLMPPHIHQGIHPENILIGKEDRLYLSGYTLLRKDADGKAYPLNPLPDYTAPEQLRGEPVPQTDLYMIGLTAIEMVSAKHYAQLPSQDIQAHLNISVDFAQILKKLVQEDPAQRQQSATALKNELMHIKRLVEEKQKDIAVDAPLKKKQMILPILAGVIGVIGIVLFVIKLINRPEVPVQASLTPSASSGQATQAPVAQPSATATTAAPEQVASPGTPDSSIPQEVPVDIYKDFEYKASDLPTGITVSETSLATDSKASEKLTAEPSYEDKARYGTISFGNGTDQSYVFAVDKDKIYVDKNNNEDLTDDGPPDSSGSTIDLKLENASAGSAQALPYRLVMTAKDKNISISGRCYYAGKLKLQEGEFDAVAIESADANGLFLNDGLWVDLNKNGNFESNEHFQDKGTFSPGKQMVQLKLNYP